MSITDKVRQYYVEVDSSIHKDAEYLVVNSAAVDRIVNFFSPNAQYDRERFEAISGTDALRRFFFSDRALVGYHQIIDIEERSGTGGLNPNNLPSGLFGKDESFHTVVVQGKYIGKLYITDRESSDGKRQIKNSFDVELNYTDYWVFEDEKAVYRKSEITPVRKGLQAAQPPENTKYYMNR